MLKNIVGTFVQREDILPNAGIRSLHYGMNPLYVIDAIYKANLNNLYGNDINWETVTPWKTTNEALTDSVPWKTMNEALDNFSMYNIVDDVDKAAQKLSANRCKSFAERDDNLKEIEDYIDQASNVFFKFNKYQTDCFSVIESVKGELFLLASQLNIKTDLKRLSDFQCASDTPYTLRSAEILIAPTSTEVKQLRKIKHLFKLLNWLIKTIICALCDLYKKNAAQEKKTEKIEDFDLEL